MKLVIILQILVLSSVVASASDPNLVGWWQFDEGAGTVAVDSGGAHNGTISGPVWAAGHTGGALQFDGINDYVAVPNAPELNITGDITIAAWVNFFEGGLGYDGSEKAIVTKCVGSGAYNNPYDFRSSIAIEPELTMIRADGSMHEVFYSDKHISLNTWHHVVVRVENMVTNFYVDGNVTGKSAGGPSLTNPPTGNNYPVLIGARNDGLYFKGLIDDVRLYNRALSASEIQMLYLGQEINGPTLVSLEIIGPNEVAEDSAASYNAVAHYSNGAAKDVTLAADWTAEPESVAVVEAGQLTTSQALYPKHLIKVYAEYTDDQITVHAQEQVSVIAICPQGNALMFDGLNDYVQIPNSQNNQITTNQLSISAWIMLNHDVGATQRRIICKQQTAPRSWGLEIGGNGYAGLVGNQMVFHDSSGSAYRNCISPMNLVPGRWYHIGVSDNAGKIRLYINGMLSQSIDNGYGIPSQITAPMIIGSLTPPDSRFFFDGVIDEVAVFNRALSDDEIQDIMNNKLDGNAPNLVAYWDFDAGTGQTVADISGHNNNGTLGNSTGSDTADPFWIKSDAPVSRCTTEQVMLRDLLGATDNKKIANALIKDAKAKEQASLVLITELQKQMNGKDKMDARKAKSHITVAIVQEETARRQIDATIKRLETALDLLNYDVDPNTEPPIPWPWQWKHWQWSCGKKNYDAPVGPSFFGKTPLVKEKHK